MCGHVLGDRDCLRAALGKADALADDLLERGLVEAGEERLHRFGPRGVGDALQEGRKVAVAHGVERNPDDLGIDLIGGNLLAVALEFSLRGNERELEVGGQGLEARFDPRKRGFGKKKLHENVSLVVVIGR